MSETVRLSSKLAKDDLTNGLDSLAGSLIADPEQVICAITWLTVRSITHDVESGADVPLVQVKRIEPIGVVSKVPAEVVQLALDLNEKRTGRSPLPFEVTETLDGGFVNPDGYDD